MARVLTKTGSSVNDYQFTYKITQTPNFVDGTSKFVVEISLTVPGAIKLESQGSGSASNNGCSVTFYSKKVTGSSVIFSESQSLSFEGKNFTAAGTYSLGTLTFEDVAPDTYGQYNIQMSNLSRLYKSVGTEQWPNWENVAYIHDSASSLTFTDFDRVVVLSTAKFPTSYLGNNATITVTKQDSALYHKLRYAIGGEAGSISNIIQAASVSWQVPFSWLTLFGTNEVQKTGIMYCDTYYPDSTQTSGYGLAGTTQSNFTVLLDTAISGPIFDPTIKDINDTTKALTGDENKLIKYFSTASVNTGATAQGGATITSQKVICGDKTIIGGSGAIPNVEVNQFIMSATDSRGLTAFYTGSVNTFIEYDKLTCNVSTTPVETDGSLSFDVSGNCFKGSFGAVSNVLTLQYRYKLNNGTYSDWINVAATPSDNNNYAISVTLTGLDYTQMYIIQARAIDKLMTVTSAEVISTGSPVYDWSKEDFNFNVPVTASQGIILPPDKTIFGADSEGNQVAALTPMTSTGDLYLGYGNYQQESGNTKIYGNNIDLIAAGDISLNGVSIDSLNKTSCGSWTPVCNACSVPTTAIGYYIRVGDSCIVNFYFQGPATLTVGAANGYLYFTGLPFTPDSSSRWYAGGGSCSGYRVLAASHVFNGWSIENAKIYGKTVYSGTTEGAISTHSYIGATGGITFYASGTIMYRIASGE